MGKTRAKYLEIKGLLDGQVQAHERQAEEAEAQQAEVAPDSWCLGSAKFCSLVTQREDTGHCHFDSRTCKNKLQRGKGVKG